MTGLRLGPCTHKTRSDVRFDLKATEFRTAAK